MAGTTNFPTSLDNNTTLDETLTDGVSGDFMLAAHQNNQNAAIKALEAKLGITSSGVNSSVDYFIRTLLGWNFAGGTTLNPSTITWTDLGTVTTVDINGGTVDGANIGVTTPGTGKFTTLEATSTVKFGTHSAIGAETVTGYITINDASGTPRKVAIVS